MCIILGSVQSDWPPNQSGKISDWHSRRPILRSLSEPALALLLLGQLEVGVGQDAHKRANDSQALVERQRVLEKHVAPQQRDAKLKVSKHIVAERVSS